MRKFLPIVILACACAGMLLIPPPKRVVDDSQRSFCAKVVETDDADVSLQGFVEFGTQRLTVELPDGRKVPAINEIRAQPELDKHFKVGDTATVILPPGAKNTAEIPDDAQLIARDYWRLGWGAAFFAAFCAFLCWFGGAVGAKALFSFVFSCVAVWKLLIPLTLAGWSPEWTAFLTVAALTAVIMYLVAGATRKGLAAFVGASLGVVASLVFAELVTVLMKIDGTTMPHSLSLYYLGYSFLDLRGIFVGATILAASGAVMDLAMDIASGVEEVKLHNSALGFAALLGSGMRIGRAVVGTMTTTLLLAYSGGYLTLLMAFAAQGTHPIDFLNSPIVAAEIVKTMVGSFGLVLVAPFTAAVSAWIYRK